MLQNHNLSCIGFSATPDLKYTPFNKVLSNYSIYDAYCDNVIVKPCVKWVNMHLSDIEIIFLCSKLISKLKYKKIVIWCGLIDECIKKARVWKKYFTNFIVSLDTSKDNNEFDSFNNFSKAESNALLFCACKHREGSDIKNSFVVLHLLLSSTVIK